MKIRHRLPLLLSVPLLFMGVATSILAYVEVRRARLSAAGDRVEVVSRLLAGSIQENLQRLREQNAGLASHPALVAHLENRTEDTASTVQGLLGGFVERIPGLAAVEVWDAEGTAILSTAPSLAAVDPQEVPGLLVRAREDQAALGKLVGVEGRLLYPAVSAIVVSGRPLGFVVQRREIATTPAALRRLKALVGSEANLFVGDVASGLWTDLEKRVALPVSPVDWEEGRSLVYSREGGDDWRIGAMARIPSVDSWSVLVEFPRRAVLGSVRWQAVRLGAITFLGTALGAALVWLMGSRLTRPLGRIADAASRIAGGDYSGRVEPGSRDDEIAQLALAFNQMAESVEQGRARLEQRVAERTAELAAANQELESFAYSVSHDLRAPLRAMDGFSLALLEDSRDRLDAEAQDHLRRIRSASQRMSQLIDDLLKLGRVTRCDLNRDVVDLSALAVEVAEQLRQVDSDRKVELLVEPQVHARGDHALLRVVLENLLSNAWKFTRGRDDARIQVGAESDGATYVVTDNGVGFDPRYASKLFVPFQRLHSARDYQGTGIGLATVRRIVNRHGGKVWAEGEVNKGATIRFTLEPAPQ